MCRWQGCNNVQTWALHCKMFALNMGCTALQSSMSDTTTTKIKFCFKYPTLKGVMLSLLVPPRSSTVPPPHNLCGTIVWITLLLPSRAFKCVYDNPTLATCVWMAQITCLYSWLTNKPNEHAFLLVAGFSCLSCMAGTHHLNTICTSTCICCQPTQLFGLQETFIYS
jgi:hypothetical protein